MAAKKRYKNFNQDKTNKKPRKRAEIRSGKCGSKNMMNAIVFRVSTCFCKESFYGMVCYAILYYGMIWYGK